MSTAALPGSYQIETQAKRANARVLGQRGPVVNKAVRRRGSLQQGFALETLGHAVEYLVDSRLFAQSEADARSDQEAIQLLMRMSRAVFAECPEVLPLRRRLGLWIAGSWQRRCAGKASLTSAGKR